MKPKENNFAYIDGANLYRGIESLGWSLDYRRFRVWLKDKYRIERAYLFLGLIPRNKNLYTELQDAGYTIVFKETVYDGEGKVKGNCDADLVLKVVCDTYENHFDQAVVVSSDGDYAGLVSFLKSREKLFAILSPYNEKCSILLKRTGAKIVFLGNFRDRLSVKEKAPDEDRTS
ncbi:MAG: NYN domain-containing protein [Candidatus Uhrbacteria bacterium]|nr:NYN domain-containing protein [Candidatus Uhrbacteria bacterium]